MHLPRLKVTFEVDKKNRLETLARRVLASGKASVELSPTFVLEQLSRARDHRLLGEWGSHEGVRKKLADDIAQRLGRALLQMEAGDSPESVPYDMRVPKVLRYWAYRYSELLWAAVRGGAWGTVRAATVSRKGREYEDGGQTDNLRDAIQSYGIRHRPPWYLILKGNRTEGRDPTRANQPSESELLMRVRWDGHDVTTRTSIAD
jgi:hypothetical protein